MRLRSKIQHGLAATILTLSVLPGFGLADPPAGTPWDRLRFLTGTWTGEGRGKSGTSRIEREYRFVLRDRFMECRNTATYAPQPANPKGEVHEDHGLFSWDRSRRCFVLRQFHVEGFVNTYAADTTAVRDSIVFTSEAIENIPAGWRARESYVVLGPDEFVERFELAGPGKSFETYTEMRFRRRK